MPGLRTTPDESGLKPPSGGAVHSPGIHARAGEGGFEDTWRFLLLPVDILGLLGLHLPGEAIEGRRCEVELDLLMNLRGRRQEMGLLGPPRLAEEGGEGERRGALA